ncbi:MAG: alpha/beta hydrolase [Enterobacterales bacterium]|nr:alpha/beta hydrolase [Enterobacterales bacterium]
MIERTLSLAGCQCHIAEWNAKAETIVLAFHGWLDNLASFESLAQHMPNIRLIAIDFPGHGHSEHHKDGQVYYFLDGLYLIDDLIEQLGLQQANLLGHSMGGAIASIYAGVQPKRVDKLVLIEALGPLTAPDEDCLHNFSQSIKLRRAIKGKRKPIYSHFDEGLTARAEVSEIAPELIRPLVDRALVEIPEGHTWRADPRLRVPSLMRLTEAQVLAILANIDADCLVIEANNGLLQQQNSEHFELRKKTIKSLEIIKLAGGHHIHLEKSSEIARLIQDFLTQ